MTIESSLLSASILLLLAVLMILPSLRKLPGLGVILAIMIIGVVVWLRGDGWAAIGLVQPESWLETIGMSILLGGLIALASTTVVEPLSERWTGAKHDLSALGTVRGNIQNTLTWIAAAWLTAATLEEFIFRGFMMREVASLVGMSLPANIINTLIVSVVFGLAHWYQSKAGALSTGIVSLLLGALFIWNGFRLWLLIMTHGMIDTVGLLMIYLGWDERLKRLIFRSKDLSRSEHEA
jgi:membrane protease YdiL (CAAX protease family)